MLGIFKATSDRTTTKNRKDTSGSGMQKRSTEGESNGLRESSIPITVNSCSSQDTWLEMKFESMDLRIISLIEFLDKHPENQSQLISDFQQYYFDQKPILSKDQIMRLFHGYLRQDGLLNILLKCH
jgi:hypothetical protein